MIKKTQEEMVTEMYVTIMGIPNTENRGLVGDVQDIKKEVRRINGDVATNTTWRKVLCFFVPFLAGAFGFLAGYILL